MTTIYGIANCDTIKKARAFLSQAGIDYRFHDYRKDGIDAALLQGFIDALGWETLLNRRGTTWRKLPQAIRDNIGADSAAEAMLANPALIKRPVLEHAGRLHIGFDAATWTEIFP